ncbi:hypothetical protein BACCAP_01291 [Pseudoflavonifractor capillosus ATCC 29799]|uniref:Uncharacterized protein n=1 Tax=Pseudoflavonifractor capillosus ATCC 29799 TaxID=411467 RepID=A6NSW2_9FIRM|nr:hypothetical protein [Pseudoflavonifractor capillosus]EDN00525.1 hypothetical protein BACCAP_01291 [Pseudoflavonifractor capillosus ATCC 29799]
MKRRTFLPIRAACAAALVLVLAAAALMLFPGSVTMAFATGPDEVTYRTCSWFDDTVWGYGLFLVPLAGLLAMGSLSGLAAGLGKNGVFPGTAWGFLIAAGCLSFIPLWMGLTPEGPNWLSIIITLCLWAAVGLLWLARPKTKA